MNRITATITEIKTKDYLTLLKLLRDEMHFSAMVTGPAEALAGLETGKQVTVLFDELDVFISRDMQPQISIQNRFPTTIKKIERGELLCELILVCAGVSFNSIITKKATEQLALKEGDEVLALIKTNRVTVAPNPS